jgi:hypothetical protein
MAKKKQTGEDGRTDRMIVAGGSFIRARYRLPPLGEDIKNAIVALFQFLVSGQKLNGPVSVEALDSLTLIRTEYGDVSVNRADHPVNRRLQTKYIFTVPMQFFIKGRRTDGRFYREMEAALRALAECRFTFIDSEDGLRHTTNTGIINDPETLSPQEGADGRNTIVTFSMTQSMLGILFDASYGFHRFIEADCMALTSIYAKRIYEQLCGWDSGTVYRMEVGRFKEMFCITGLYSQLSDLRKRVLEPAVKEINEKTDLTVNFSLEKGASDTRTRVIVFKVLRNPALLVADELSRKYIVWPEARLMEFLTGDVGMRRSEIRPHALLFHRVSLAPALMAELPRKWEKTCGRIPADGTDRASRERVRRERVAHFIASLQGMLDDYGL